MRDDLINHIIKEKKVVIICGLIFVQIYFRKMHFLHFWPLGLHKKVKNFIFEKKNTYWFQKSKMLDNWTINLFFENFEFSKKIPDLATQIKKNAQLFERVIRLIFKRYIMKNNFKQKNFNYNARNSSP